MSFVAGTLVHTDKGLMPIQDIKVGDLVLSKINDDGELVSRKITKTVTSSEPKRIYKVEYHNDSLDEDINLDEDERHNDSYIFCTDIQKIRVSTNNLIRMGWQPAKNLFSRELFKKCIDEYFKSYEEGINPPEIVSVSKDKIQLSKFSFLPVRTLPNFPQDCAYTYSMPPINFILANIDWSSDFDVNDFLDSYWEEYRNIEFVSFDKDSYCLVSLGEEKYYNHDKYQLNLPTADSFSHVNKQVPFKIDIDLYKKLNNRLFQDTNPYANRDIESFKEFYNSPSYYNGNIIEKNKLGSSKNKKIYENGLINLEKYGNAEGLLDSSIHESMARFDDPCPNPFMAHVYQLEVEETHSYFVGQDGIWVSDGHTE